MLRVALPKGRMAQKVLVLLQKAGYAAPSDASDRRLLIESMDGLFTYFMVKPGDVAIYVERGVADVGIVGRDVLLETTPNVYELLDLGLGKCRLAVAGFPGVLQANPLKVATKYPHVALTHFQKQGILIDVIPLNGSIELAPLLGLSDVIVDIVETGTTLKENGLSILAEIAPSSARLIAGKSAYAFQKAEIDALSHALKGVLP